MRLFIRWAKKSQFAIIKYASGSSSVINHYSQRFWLMRCCRYRPIYCPYIATNDRCLLQGFDRCFIGSSPDQKPENLLTGQISCIYGFAESLNPHQIASIHSLGPSYKVIPRHCLNEYLRRWMAGKCFNWNGPMTLRIWDNWLTQNLLQWLYFLLSVFRLVIHYLSPIPDRISNQ